MFGSRERWIADLYRRIYVDLDAWARQIYESHPDARRILEVGAGEGALTTQLARAFRSATITAIDITPRVGRLFDGDADRVTFRQVSVGEIATSEPKSFDLVVMCDVLHHVPIPIRSALLDAISRLIVPGGTFAFKDWTPSRHLIHWLCLAADRYLTGDEVSYCTASDIRGLLAQAFGPDAVRSEYMVRPWPNNLAMLVRPL